MSRFAGNVAFVTGATSGIGRATALALARERAGVVVAGVAADGNRETAGLIEQASGRWLCSRRGRVHRRSRDGRRRGQTA